MKGFYFVHLATGVVLIAVLAAFFNLRDETAGRSGMTSVGTGRGSEPVSVVGRSLGTLLPPRSDDAPLTFTNHLGEKVSEDDLRGHYSLVFFGYSSCPDVCPSNLVTMARALTSLGEAAERVQPVFVSFDPDRDTPEVLRSYVAHFDSRLIGLTGTHAEIEAATRAYGVYFELGTGSDGGTPAGDFQHTSNTFLLDEEVQAVSIFRHDTEPEEMAALIRDELEQSRAGTTKELSKGATLGR